MNNVYYGNNSTLTVGCNSGYTNIGGVKYTCSNGSWVKNGSCELTCSRADLNNKINGTLGSQLYPNSTSPTISGTQYNNYNVFAINTMVEANCASGYTEVSTCGEITSTWGNHAYKCVNENNKGVWKRMGSCTPSGNKTFNYTRGVQTFTVPSCVTTLTLEVWGAQGGNNNNGGKGGYATGKYSTTSGKVLYIIVGGQGGHRSGGFNGGGTGGYGGDSSGYGGGGATHISTVVGLLNNENVWNNVIVVAGGGGGATDTCGRMGGYGGGDIGGDGTGSPGRGGNTTNKTGGSGYGGNNGGKGYGGNGRSGSTAWHDGGGAGGGGYYGGGGGDYDSDGCSTGGGGGGSGFCGNGATDCSQSANSRTGNGYAKISW